MPSFLAHYWFPVWGWVNDAPVGVLFKYFASSRVRHVQTPIL